MRAARLFVFTCASVIGYNKSAVYSRGGYEASLDRSIYEYEKISPHTVGSHMRIKNLFLGVERILVKVYALLL